jgi:hypothetical protein
MSKQYVPIFQGATEPLPEGVNNDDEALAERLCEWLAELCYRHGWAIFVRFPGEAISGLDPEVLKHLSLVVTAQTQDAEGRGPMEASQPIAVPASATRVETLAAIFSVITATEGHERLEHYRLGDEPVFPPHDIVTGEPFVIWRTMAPSPDWYALNSSRGYWAETQAS